MTRFGTAFLFSTLLAGCSAPDPAPVTVQLLSESGRVSAEVRVVTPVVRGVNELFVDLAPSEGSSAELVAVEAVMAAHGHHAQADHIERDAEAFHVEALDLFMTGRWLIELSLEVDGEADHASLPVDVP